MHNDIKCVGYSPGPYCTGILGTISCMELNLLYHFFMYIKAKT